MLLEAGAVTKATLCFSSLDIFGQAKRFQAAVEDGTLELSEWTAHAFAQALSAGKRRLPSEPFTWPAGSDLAELPTFPASGADPVSGERIGIAPALRPDVLLLHAPAADEDGNIVLVGARAMELVMVPASREVLVTVDAVVSRDELRRMPAGIVISRHFVSAIAVVPGGAAPTSSLPYYLADFDGLRDWTAAEHPTAFARDAAGDDEGEVSRLAELDAASVASGDAERRGRRHTGHSRRVDDLLARAPVSRWFGLLGRRRVAARLGVLSPREGDLGAIDDAHHQRRLLHRRRTTAGAVRAGGVARHVLGAHRDGR